jgi:hypothetical protein
MLHTLLLTEFSRRYDALFVQPQEDLHRLAYLSLVRVMCNLPFTGISIQLNAILALCCMVINPAYYTHQSSKSREESQRLQATARRYLCIVDPDLDTKALNKSLEAQVLPPTIPPTPLKIEDTRFTSFSYPLQHDLEWALECARLIEKHLFKNSQQFTITVDNSGRSVYNGVDFASILNYQWNPQLLLLAQELQDFHRRRRFKFMKTNLDTRAQIVEQSR